MAKSSSKKKAKQLQRAEAIESGKLTVAPKGAEKVELTEKERKKIEKEKAKANKKPNVFKRLLNYFSDVKSEMKRVTWPTRKEVARSSLVVICALVFFGLLIFAIDSAVVPLLTAYSGLAA